MRRVRSFGIGQGGMRRFAKTVAAGFPNDPPRRVWLNLRRAYLLSAARP